MVTHFLHLLRRLPHRRGYGIHSPFAFGLVTGVVYERGTFYAYEHLAKERAGAALREKDDRLLFRLANFQQPRRGLFVGDISELTKKYVGEGCKACLWMEDSGDDDTEVYDMVVADAASLAGRETDLLSQLAEEAMVVVVGIEGSQEGKKAWEALCRSERVRLSFDLLHIGIACLHPRFAKQHFPLFYA